MFFLLQAAHGTANPGRSPVQDVDVNQGRFHVVMTQEFLDRAQSGSPRRSTPTGLPAATEKGLRKGAQNLQKEMFD